MCARSRHGMYTRESARCDGAFNQGVPSESSPYNRGISRELHPEINLFDDTIIHGGVFALIESDFLEKRYLNIRQIQRLGISI